MYGEGGQCMVRGAVYGEGGQCMVKGGQSMVRGVSVW